MISEEVDESSLTGESHAKATPVNSAVKIIKILAIVGCLGLISIGCFGFWFAWHTYKDGDEIDPQLMLLSVYMVLFGTATCLAEIDHHAIFHKFPFLQSRLGRGLTYIFIGSLVFVQGVRFEDEYYEYFTVTCGGYEMGVGTLLVFSYCCMSTGHAGRYNLLEPSV